MVPIWDADKKVTGLIDVLNKRAYEDGRTLSGWRSTFPEDKADVVAEFNEALKESVAETSDEMMDKYFSGESFTYAEMIQGLRQGVRELSMFPVLFGSAINCIGSLMLMDYIVDLLPNPPGGQPPQGPPCRTARPRSSWSPPAACPPRCVFKTISDQYGKYSYVKVLSGSAHARHCRWSTPAPARGEAGPPVHDAGQEGRGGQGALLRRHRRHRQDGKGQDRRHPV
ncbi:MAG: hypothetical protein ACLT9P_09475 [Evtepia gabavorous]